MLIPHAACRKLVQSINNVTRESLLRNLRHFHERRGRARALNSSIRPWTGYIQVDVSFLSLHRLDMDGYDPSFPSMDCGVDLLGSLTRYILQLAGISACFRSLIQIYRSPMSQDMYWWLHHTLRGPSFFHMQRLSGVSYPELSLLCRP
jgi:hypothetical protein